MPKRSKTKCIGILTSGGDCPGLNAAIRGVAKAAMTEYGIDVIGIMDGFRGLVENRYKKLDDRSVSGILTLGGTFLGTSRDKPHKMPMGGKKVDMTDVAIENAKKMGIDCLVCLGGGGTQKNAKHLMENGLNVMTLPKTIDNDVFGTDYTFGYDTALNIASEAIDRLHTTATSHHRLIVCEIMGHNSGWLPLGAGIAGGADVILIPEIPYNLEAVAEHLRERRRGGKKFSIIAVAEGAHNIEEAREVEKQLIHSGGAKQHEEANKATAKNKKGSKNKKVKSHKKILDELRRCEYSEVQEPIASRVARNIQKLTGFEARVTSLGHVQRGGSPSPADRLLCTVLGTKAAQLLAQGEYNCMVNVLGNVCGSIDINDVAGKCKKVPLDHHWLDAARMVETCLGV